jgi:hypothetical protein
MHVFARVFARDLLPVYYRLRETLSQMETLRNRAALVQSTPIAPTLTNLLRSVHSKAPAQLQAS